jgi:hypothetical protein
MSPEERIKELEKALHIVTGYLSAIRTDRIRELDTTLLQVASYLSEIRATRTIEIDGVVFTLQTLEYVQGVKKYTDMADKVLGPQL